VLSKSKESARHSAATINRFEELIRTLQQGRAAIGWFV
jgi:hypothetical protein